MLVITILAVMLPGLLGLDPQPVVAAASVEVPQVAGGSAETPKQSWGTAAGLPSLAPASATRTLADPGTPKGKAKPLKKALSQEERSGVVRVRRTASSPQATPSPSGTTKAGVAAAQYCSPYDHCDPPCGSYSPWQRGVYVAYGTYVAAGLRIWKAIQNIPASLNTFPPHEEPTGWMLIGDCPKPPPPTVTSMSPDNGIQVMTTEPTLSVTATTWYGGSIGQDFEICETPSMSRCTTHSDCCNPSSTWTVPEGTLAWGRQYWWRVQVSDASTIGGQSAYSDIYTLVVGVRQPTITSQLSIRGVNGQEFNQQSGNYTTTFTDLQVGVAGPPLSVVRSFNSMDPRRDGAFGAGWATRWDMRIVQENVAGREAALATYPDGRQVRFAKKSDGGYQPPPGMYATLAKNADGSWRLMDKSSTSYQFDSGGRLLKVTDNRGRVQELAYGTDGKLAKVTAPGGRSLTFTWTGAHVTAVSTDPVDGKPLTWTYAYNGDVLEKVCDPADGCTLYEHSPGSLYRSTVLDSDPLGYWRLGESEGYHSKDLGWGAEDAHYDDKVTLGKPGALAGTADTAVDIAPSTSANISLPDGFMSRVGKWASAELWFKTTATGTIMRAHSLYDNATGPMLQVTSAGKLSASFHQTTTPGSGRLTPTTPPPSGSRPTPTSTAAPGSSASAPSIVPSAPPRSWSPTRRTRRSPPSTMPGAATG
ncbi:MULTISPECIES: DUF6531 domain-containing protein [unclassified Nonomuraea]|uniref:RHS repeat domain-containing protein n=1 Tax=unclassified Nonomuraea TaxID=2593643 RepID=UPI0033DC9CEF